MKFSKSSKSSNLRKHAKVHLPKDYQWKLLGNVADDLGDCLDTSELTYLHSVIRSRDTSKLMLLAEAWGPQSINSGDISLVKVKAKYQIAALLKKYLFSSDAKSRRATAIEKFLEAEGVCRLFNAFQADKLRWLEDEDELCIFTHAHSFIRKVLGEFLPSEDTMTLWSRHGPGANLDTLDGTVSLYDKYRNWPYSCTEDALGFARSAIQADERWIGALEDDYRKRYNIPAHVILNQDTFWSNVLKPVPGNRITFVPKNSHTDRSIAIEPAMNLYLQLGVDGYIRRRLKRWGVDLDSQEKNQVLAGVGSRDWEGDNPFVTLDLAAASDTISVEVCRVLLPPQWFSYLMKLRSPQGTLGDDTIIYEKVSSMGNGFTFALESLLFTAVVYGVTKHMTGSFDRDEVAVFGDDIIVRKNISDCVVRTLNLFGFSVNHEKSFFEGPFRESCGADWFKGTPVRPVFVTETPSMVMGLWNDINRLQRSFNLRYGMTESKTVDWLKSFIPPLMRRFVGPYSDEEFDSYCHVPSSPVSQARWVWEFRRLIVARREVSAKAFFFRKLMHSLRESPSEPHYLLNDRHLMRNRFFKKLGDKVWGGARLTGEGSIFAVPSSSGIRLSENPSETSYWSREYAEQGI